MKENKKKVVEDIDTIRVFESATTNKDTLTDQIYINLKTKFIRIYRIFVLIGSMLNGEIEQNTIIRYESVDDFETYVNTINNGGYDSYYYRMVV